MAERKFFCNIPAKCKICLSLYGVLVWQTCTSHLLALLTQLAAGQENTPKSWCMDTSIDTETCEVPYTTIGKALVLEACLGKSSFMFTRQVS